MGAAPASGGAPVSLMAGASGGPGGATGKAGGAGANGTACGASGSSATFEESCLACAANDCERCLCTDCTAPVERCAETSGCPAILACIREQQCTGLDCYCGSYDPITCVMGQSNGPCKSVILEAPDSREPTIASPSAGPASDAALAIADCAQPNKPCAGVCPL
jgi:hypothetical protein